MVLGQKEREPFKKTLTKGKMKTKKFWFLGGLECSCDPNCQPAVGQKMLDIQKKLLVKGKMTNNFRPCVVVLFDSWPNPSKEKKKRRSLSRPPAFCQGSGTPWFRPISFGSYFWYSCSQQVWVVISLDFL